MASHLSLRGVVKWKITHYNIKCNSASTNDENSLSKRSVPLSERQLKAAVSLTRRSVAVVLSLGMLPKINENAALAVEQALPSDTLSLDDYKNTQAGFSLKKPYAWNQVEKPGAVVLFEDPEKKSNTIGVVVNPVRIRSLTDFGSLDDVAVRVINAEKKKESTKSVQLLSKSIREASGNVPVYSLEYALDTTRGSKRIFSAVLIHEAKLYIVSATLVDSVAQPASFELVKAVREVVDSFDLL